MQLTLFLKESNKIRSEVKKLDFSLYSLRIQAVFNSILDGRKYYLRDASVGENW